jgi:hypothetical protein
MVAPVNTPSTNANGVADSITFGKLLLRKRAKNTTIVVLARFLLYKGAIHLT